MPHDNVNLPSIIYEIYRDILKEEPTFHITGEIKPYGLIDKINNSNYDISQLWNNKLSLAQLKRQKAKLEAIKKSSHTMKM